MIVIGYSFEEALASLRRSGRSALVSIGTIAIAFVTLGGFLLISVNVQDVLDGWLEAAEISVYLGDTASESDRVAVEAFLRERPEVAAVEYVSKDRAFERFRTDFPELADVTGSLSQNPFPASLEVRLRGDDAGGASAEALARDVAAKSGVADVQFDRTWLSRLIGAVTTARLGAAVVAGILMLGAAFTVGAVVRLSLYARRDELEIMALVGAPFSYIRGPFVVEGLMLGGLGAAVALAVVGVLYSFAGRWLGSDLAGLGAEGQMRFLGYGEMAIMLLGGVLVGAGAGTLASRAAHR
ncbi:MAG TPA: ABC transporter permease [Vicinamibacterales bacterium]|nr:ABC transporter permease [Vicinamibacterales bacterium]